MASRKRTHSVGYKPKRLEKHIQEDILKWLGTTGLLFWRQNSGKIPIFLGKSKSGKPRFRFVKLGVEGLPDIIAVIPPTGRFLGLEVKSATGVQREAQKAFQSQLEASGGVYEIVRSVEDAERVIQREWLKAMPSTGAKALKRKSA